MEGIFSRNVGEQVTRSVINIQTSEDLNYTAAEVWNVSDLESTGVSKTWTVEGWP